MQIIKSTDAITVDHPVVCIFGQPGIGKTSLGYSAKDPLLLDLDQGAHRAVNRKDTLKITTWADVAELTESRQQLAPYATLVVDTVGRLLDLMTADIIDQNPKYSRDGALTLQGFGVLKTRFRTWITQLRTMGKDIVLLSHHKEEKDGDVTVVRPDIIGASYGEVMKLSDFVGFLYMRGKDRVLDFSPTDRWVGKNPAQWKPIAVPPADKAQTVLADLADKGRAALGAISQASADAAATVDAFKADAPTWTTVEQCNHALDRMKAMTPATAKAAARKVLWDRVKALRFEYDEEAAAFLAPAPPPPAAPLPVTAEQIPF